MSTGFRIPAFPITANLWHPPNAPPAAPDLTIDCQLRGPAIHSSGLTEVSVGGGFSNPWTATLLMPALTDVRDGFTSSGNDIAEVPAGSGRFYFVTYVEDIAKGFANEHRWASIIKRGTWPTPIP